VASEALIAASSVFLDLLRPAETTNLARVSRGIDASIASIPGNLPASHNPRPGAVELPPVRPGTPVTFSSSIDYPGAFHRHTWDGVAQEYTHSGPERHDHLFVFAGPTTADDVERIPLHIHVHTFNDTPDSAQ